MAAGKRVKSFVEAPARRFALGMALQGLVP